MYGRLKRAYDQQRPMKVRVVVDMPKDEAEAIDNWGVPNGMTSRTAAVRELLRKGLEAAGEVART